MTMRNILIFFKQVKKNVIFLQSYNSLYSRWKNGIVRAFTNTESPVFRRKISSKSLSLSFVTFSALLYWPLSFILYPFSEHK